MKRPTGDPRHRLPRLPPAPGTRSWTLDAKRSTPLWLGSWSTRMTRSSSAFSWLPRAVSQELRFGGGRGALSNENEEEAFGTNIQFAGDLALIGAPCPIVHGIQQCVVSPPRLEFLSVCNVSISHLTRALWSLAQQTGEDFGGVAPRAPRLQRPPHGNPIATAEYEDELARFMLKALKQLRANQ